MRAVELGWSKVLHDAVERSARSDSRHEHSIERIGKKYQWIAFAELIGCLADHHWYVDWGRQPEVLDRPDAFLDFNIDPSFLAHGDVEPAHDARVPSLRLPATDFRTTSVGDALAWTETTADLPDVPLVVEGLAMDSRRWWLVRAWRQDRDYLQKLQTDGPFRTGQFFLDMILVRAEDAERLYSQFRDTDIVGSSLTDRDYNPSRLFGEHSYDLLSVRLEDMLSREHQGFAVGDIASALHLDRGEYDLSNSPEKPVAVPTDALVQALRLRPENPESPAFVTDSGRLAFLDTRYAHGEQDGAVLIDADLLDSALGQHGLVGLWVLRAEKDGGQGRGPRMDWGDDVDRRGFGGIWWKEAGTWRGSTWASPEGWNERRS
jgi:hypothetical protein